MTMGPQSEDPVATQACFHKLAELLKQLQSQYQHSSHPFKDLQYLSMGMTGDLEIAIAEGSHWIRIGTGLFGHR
jgi:PLP dependent protein